MELSGTPNALRKQDDVGPAGLGIHSDHGVGADQRRVAPEVGAGVFALAGAMHARPGTEGARSDDGSAMGHVEGKRGKGRVGQAGEAGEGSRRDELGFAAQLHAAHDGGEVDVAATLAGADEGALHLHGAGENGGARVGHAQAAIGVTMEAEMSLRMAARQLCEDVRHLFRAGAPGGVADDDAAGLLAYAKFRDLAEVVEAALPKGRIAKGAVFAASAGGVHGVFQVDEDFEAVILKALDGFRRHAQVLFRGGFEGTLDIQEPRFDHHHGDGYALLVADHELDVGPVFDAGAAAARAAKQSQFHRTCWNRAESLGEVGDKLIGSGKADLGIVNAKAGHALQKADRVGNGDVEIGLLHAVAQAGVEDLDFRRFELLVRCFRSWFTFGESRCVASHGRPAIRRSIQRASSCWSAVPAACAAWTLRRSSAARF